MYLNFLRVIQNGGPVFFFRRFGPQSADFAARIVNRVIRQMEKKREEKMAKRAARDGGHRPEEQGDSEDS